MADTEALSLEETNKIRASLGLAPLADPGQSGPSAPVQTEEEVAVENYKQVKAQADAERSAKELQERLDKARNQRDLKAKLSGKGLGEGTDADSARAWVKKLKKNSASVQAELARKRQQEQEELDRELQAKYDESSLAGLKVGHDADAFKEGEQETILTLKDNRILDGDDDELVNVNLAEQERLNQRLELKKKGQSAGKYTGYDDDEFQEGGSKGILSKYDADIKEANFKDGSVGFTLGAVVRRDDEEQATGFRALAKPAIRDKEEVARELQKTLADLNYTKNIEVSDYVQEGDVGFKKLKKKKKSTKSTRKIQVDDPDPSEMQVDERSRTTQQELEAQALLDDEDLQAALARERRAKNKKALLALKRNAEAALQVRPETPGMDVDGAESPLPIKQEESDDQEDQAGGLVLDDTSEFVKGIQLPTFQPKNSIPTPAAPASPVRQPTPVKQETPALDEQPLTEVDVDMQTDVKEEEPTADVKPEPDAFEGTQNEMHVGRGLSSTLSILRQRGLVKAVTEEEKQADEEYKQKQAWLNQRRLEQLQLQQEKAASRAAGATKDQRTRELENRQREKEHAQRDLEHFKNYKPNVQLKYNDEFGREMTPKEAWKFLSHKFHGKGSGTKTQEKRLKKIAEERKREAMVSGDTPLSTNAAFQARQEKLGTATMILSVGNKMTAPGVEDFQTTGALDPSKASTGKKKKKKDAVKGPEVNLTPSLDVPTPAGVASASTSATVDSPAPPPKRAGFQRINKRPAEQQDGQEAKRLKADDA